VEQFEAGDCDGGVVEVLEAEQGHDLAIKMSPRKQLLRPLQLAHLPVPMPQSATLTGPSMLFAPEPLAGGVDADHSLFVVRHGESLLDGNPGCLAHDCRLLAVAEVPKNGICQGCPLRGAKHTLSELWMGDFAGVAPAGWHFANPLARILNSGASSIRNF
jgi:hypothetical protein